MTILDQLVAASRSRARLAARNEPLGELRRAVERLPEAPRFERAIRYAGRLAVVAEVKRASPSHGAFAVPSGPVAVGELSRRYAAAGATCLSVLTEPTRFDGSDADLEAAARTGLPVLRKDFVVDRYQVWEARWLGASAVLLIARILPGAALRQLIAEAAAAGLDALVEVHDRVDLERALEADATLIGVNARDLASLDVDLGRAIGLLQAARHTGATLIAESGLSEVRDLERVAEAGARGVLVGTALLAAADPAATLDRLVAGAPRLPAPRVAEASRRARVKVCGLRDRTAVR
ncbi:MAG TPA: indole-3-glycerol phosphate synthase TrpC, partial [Candidatus Binatia bacterium]|nr:indole-3-glycerol phosphate synthase TrpC [Candidatus Binatia bacterium]